MARVSIDSLQSSESSSKGGASAKASHGGKAAKPAGAGMDSKQKRKAVIAIAVILLAGVVIAWNAGVFEGGPRVNANAAPDASPEQTAAFEEAQKQTQQREQEQKSTGSTRLPPMPLGSN